MTDRPKKRGTWEARMLAEEQAWVARCNQIVASLMIKHNGIKNDALYEFWGIRDQMIQEKWG